ncbi:Amidohydrolase [Aquisphaera giovannonii]|uniref:Amidohydrolase n=1 Tax=Aquisphaera giovannonii TaxID=406548 RepID=A0A5B9VZ67_9BACT|nr:amidohydrolase [Aquisphaera giovannonii]QEH33642.1 Amidohydrolase [Aquisphaera giovannonii]
METMDAMTRREALQVAAASALAVPKISLDEAAPAAAIIDTHVHLWDLKTFRLPWIERGSPLDSSYTPADYAAATAGLGVVKAVYMEVDVEPAQQGLEARTISELCRRGGTPIVAAVISGRPADESFADYIKPLASDTSIKGVRQVLHGGGTPPGYCLAASFVRGIRLLGELGLSFDLCMRADELGDGLKLIEACPGTQFILDHCGNPEVYGADLGPWKKGLAAIAGRPNVACKVSGIVASTKGHDWKPEDLAPIINHVLDCFGPDRVVFGGDWPVCTLGAPLSRWVEALREVVRARIEADRRKLFHDNAVRVYKLDR